MQCKVERTVRTANYNKEKYNLFLMPPFFKCINLESQEHLTVINYFNNPHINYIPIYSIILITCENCNFLEGDHTTIFLESSKLVCFIEKNSTAP